MPKPKFEKLNRFLRNLKNEIIQDVPGELEECLVCGKTECSNGEWLNCEKRIAHMNRKNARMEDSKNSENKN